MKAKFAAVIVFIALILSMGQVQAADKMELARQYIELCNLEETINFVVSDVTMKTMFPDTKQAGPDKKIQREKTRAKKETLHEAFARANFLKRQKEEGAKMAAEIFSEDELKALVRFYSSKEGQSISKKMPYYILQIEKKAAKMTRIIVQNYLEANQGKKK